MPRRHENRYTDASLRVALKLLIRRGAACVTACIIFLLSFSSPPTTFSRSFSLGAFRDDGTRVTRENAAYSQCQQVLSIMREYTTLHLKNYFVILLLLLNSYYIDNFIYCQLKCVTLISFTIDKIYINIERELLFCVLFYIIAYSRRIGYRRLRTIESRSDLGSSHNDTSACDEWP